MQKLCCELCGSNSFMRTSDGFFRCECCNTKYSKDRLLNININAQTVGGVHADVVNSYKGNASDFEVIGGVLKEYRGSAIDIVIPDGVIEINDSVFEDMKHIRSVYMPDSVRVIGKYLFRNCTALEKVRLSNSLKALHYTFCGCKNLKEIVLPPNVEILKGTFSESGIVSLEIPPYVRVIDFAASDCKFLREVILSDGIEAIGDSNGNKGGYVFAGCSSLHSVVLPGTVHTIGHSAFSGSGIEDIVLPASVEYIGERAFMECKNLLSVTVENSNAKFGSYAFKDCSNLTIFNSASKNISHYMLSGTPLWKKRCQRCGGATGLFGCDPEGRNCRNRFILASIAK